MLAGQRAIHRACIGHRLDPETLLLQIALEEVAKSGVVIDDEDAVAFLGFHVAIV